MEKPKLLYASPFWPMKSGISEYSENLLMGLERFFDITLLTDQYTLQNKQLIKRFPVIRYQRSKKYKGFDYIIYNIGNNPDFHSYMIEAMQSNPGFVILHDYSLYYLAVDYYQEKGCLFQKLYELHGVEGITLVKNSLKRSEQSDLLQHKNLASLLPLNKEFLVGAKGVFVHSEYTKSKLREECNIEKVKIIPFCQPQLEMAEPKDKSILSKKFNNIRNNDYVIGSAGFIAPSKQNELICKAVLLYNKTHKKKVHYVMIGDGNYVDTYLGEYIHKTGFTGMKDFFDALDCCDLIFNLRYPYGGETSATLLQCMSKGLPCVITNIGWFGELPQDCVIKIDKEAGVENIIDIIKNCIDSDLTSFKKNAVRYIKENCDPVRVAEKIFNIINDSKIL